MSNEQIMTITYHYEIDDELKIVSVEREGDQFRVTVGERSYLVAAELWPDGPLSLELEGQRWLAHTAGRGERRYVALDGESWAFAAVSRQQARRRRQGALPDLAHSHLQAAMPGQVVTVLVAEGDAVERGQTLVLLEAMKMELRVTAPYDGRVKRVECVAGQVVERGQMLVEVEAA
jgi:biotin carboxyl carrier protein